MEVGPWRCVQGSNECKIILCLCGTWSTFFCDDSSDNDICHPWFHFSLKPWRFDGYYGCSWVCLLHVYIRCSRAQNGENTLKTTFLFLGIVFCIFFILNALIWGEKSSGAIPFGTMFALILLWFGISVPLVFVGSYFGYKKPAIEDPMKTNKIPRKIPEQAWYMRPIFLILIGGIFPFGAVFIELFFIFTSIWLHHLYYIFGFMFIAFVILIVTCAKITIVLCYFQLHSEDYHWWWRAYLTAGSSAFYLFLYATFCFFTKLEMTKLVYGIFYFGYMTIISYSFFVLTGTIGFYACL